MSDVAIRVEGLGKKYRLGANAQPYKTLRTSLADVAAAPLWAASRLIRRPRAAREGSHRPEFWALKDVSFDVKQGEVLGIIGRNGAGKSTLLKLLSQITAPTEGCIKINGRVASLLEVGTGFHPDLTGRENVLLGGAILGMSRADITRKFDEIVAFAEVEKFIDTPVKHYSSGMYLRLAFAVAAHLEPEILVVDEVLAVGDISFQRKCVNKMQDVGQQGRMVLFVSHNMPAVTRLCDRVVLLDKGAIIVDGPAHQVVNQYLRAGWGTTALREWPDSDQAPGNEIVRLRKVRVRTEEGQTREAVDIRRPVGIEITYDVLRPGHVLVPNFHFFNEEGIVAFIASDQNWKDRTRPVGHYISTAWIPGNLLSEGTLIVGAAISTMDPVTVHFYERDAVAFQVIDSLAGDSARGNFAGPMPGVFRPLLHWTTQSNPDERPAAT
jgi:lipopolysaccharide transport system ATP-binding protein